MADEIPADVRAAAIRFHELECEIAGKPQAWDDISPESQMVAETFAREMIAASDRVRMERAGDVVERLRDVRTRIGKMCSQGRPPLMSIPPRPMEDDDFVICAAARDAATLITTLRAALSEAQAERDAARERQFVAAARLMDETRINALREAADRLAQCRDSLLAQGAAGQSWGFGEARAAILALIPEPKDQADAG